MLCMLLMLAVAIGAPAGASLGCAIPVSSKQRTLLYGLRSALCLSPGIYTLREHPSDLVHIS